MRPYPERYDVETVPAAGTELVVRPILPKTRR
jgi:hypothetical protein